MFQANKVVKQAIESLYDRKATVVEYQKVLNTDGSTGFKEVTVLTDIPCRLSYKSKVSTTPTASASIMTQQIELLINPEVKIKAGSKVIINTEEYIHSGKTAMYANHQEIMLDLFEGWS